MALFSHYKREDPMDQGPPEWPLDLGRFRIGPHPLGGEPDRSELWGRLMRGDAVCRPEGTGVEVGLRDGRIESVFVDLASFHGGFLRHGEPLPIDARSTEDGVRELFGEPYWTDRSDDEVILFYEYEAGTVELQFEFPGAGALGFATLARNGVLSDAAQRRAYGCDRPWPPA